MVNLDMSGENLAEVQHNVETPNKVIVGTSIPRKIPGRVDINNLMSKVREEERKQKKENIVLFGFISGVIVVTGIIASL